MDKYLFAVGMTPFLLLFFYSLGTREVLEPIVISLALTGFLYTHTRKGKYRRSYLFIVLAFFAPFLDIYSLGDLGFVVILWLSAV
ncbi:hypothetical protein [Sulfuracidifex tepidarius]|uniref:Uncharacterized protein n=1 Tax=Sulfuracidifex tepidarius TaxID=1294262 RepID=A0A510E0P1_9CREN|nr:hypothetical protein [Sulfuracidifex tepidarius]BBG26007.1 hypothetical protein IC007_0512 [Sulfuracidifex tepidarius]